MSEVFCSILGENVFNVEIFENANSLLKYIENNPLQVVLAEYKIPEINDIKHIEQLNKARIGVPVIIVSSYTVGIDTKFAYKVLSKPVDADVLIDTIQKALLDRYSSQNFDIDLALVKKIDLIVMGGSTGAPQIFQQVLSQAPKPFPPNVVV